MNTLNRRIKKVEDAILTAKDKELYNKVIIAQINNITGMYEVIISGEKHQGTKEEIKKLLEPYRQASSVFLYRHGAAIIWDDIE